MFLFYFNFTNYCEVDDMQIVLKFYLHGSMLAFYLKLSFKGFEIFFNNVFGCITNDLKIESCK